MKTTDYEPGENMTETEIKKNTALSEHITRIFTEGMHLDKNTIHFLNSTSSIFSAGELEEALSNPDSDDSDVLFELVFFPDENARIKIEPLLHTTMFTKEDELSGYTVPPESEEEVCHRLNVLNQIISIFPCYAVNSCKDNLTYRNIGCFDKNEDLEKIFVLFK